MTTPDAALNAVLVPSNEIPTDAITVTGPSIYTSLNEVLDSYHTIGYQATNLGLAIKECEAMLNWRLINDQKSLEYLRTQSNITDNEAEEIKTKIFLGLTSNLMLAGTRESVNFLCRHKLIDVIVTPGGGVDFDVLRSISPSLVKPSYYDSNSKNPTQSRQGNICFEENESREAVVSFILKVLESEEKKRGDETKETIQADVGLPFTYTPSELIKIIGKHLEEYDSSCLHWCAKNDIPIYCPSIVDGWVGHALFKFNKRRKSEGKETLKIDLVKDVKQMNTEAVYAKHTGMLILGGGVVKHHICNANLMRNGADHSVLIGTGQEFDGSDAGARPDEAISWGKIRPGTKPVKVYTDATVALPIVVAKAFFPYYIKHKDIYP